MVSLKHFLAAVLVNADRIHDYGLGHDGSDETSDCIGLIIGALELCGFDWPGAHGSNWAARNAMATFGLINSASECFPGEIVYKVKEPGEAGYDLPSSYKNSPDQRDYYHVGVVTSVNPFCITHCTGVDGGIKRDNTLGKWRWGGKLKYVDYNGNEAAEKPIVYKATVYAENGYPVKMRKLPSAQSSVILQVPLGATVEVTGEVDAVWAAIDYKGIQGYMMRKFLRRSDSEPTDETAEKNEGGMDMEYPYYATVWSPNMYPVKVRKEPKANADVIKKIDNGEIVVVMGEIGTEEDGIWGFIRYGAVTGYMMKKFLKPVQDENEDKDEQQDADFPVTLTAEEYNEMMHTLEKAVEVLKKARDKYEG